MISVLGDAPAVPAAVVRGTVVGGLLVALLASAACGTAPDGSSEAGVTPSAGDASSTAASASPDGTSLATTSRPTTRSTAVTQAGALPGDLTPNVMKDECLLTADEFGALTGRTGVRSENTELVGGAAARRSCFYAPEAADDPAGRIDVYASQSLPPPELVSRIATNGGRALSGVGHGAVVVSGQDGAFELVVASPTLLAVLTVLPGGTAVPPPDQAWSTAAAAMAGRLTG